MTAAMTARDELRVQIDDYVGECSDDELRAVIVLLARLETGRRRYGALYISTDPRDWTREADEELEDLAIYLSFARLARREGSPR